MAQTEEKLFIVTLPYACFGITVKGDIVTEAPPIGRWMVGRDFTDIIGWVEKKRGRIDGTE